MTGRKLDEQTGRAVYDLLGAIGEALGDGIRGFWKAKSCGDRRRTGAVK